MKSLSLARPHAIMVVGVPGSGKTYFAERFAETFRAPFINANQLVDQYADADTGYTVAGQFANELAKTGQTFLYEGATDSRTHRSEFARWARSKGYQPLLVWVQTDRPTATDRTRKSRGLSAHEYEQLARSFSPPHTSESAVVISGKHTYATQAKVVLNRLAQARPTPPSSEPRTDTPSAARHIRVG